MVMLVKTQVAAADATNAAMTAIVPFLAASARVLIIATFLLSKVVHVHAEGSLMSTDCHYTDLRPHPTKCNYYLQVLRKNIINE